MKKFWHIGLLLSAGVLVIILLQRSGYGLKVSAAVGDNESDPQPPAEGVVNASVVNTSPGVNQTYNIPNPPMAGEVSSDASYLTPAQLEASLSTQSNSVVQNILSVGADYSEFVPTSEALQG